MSPRAPALVALLLAGALAGCVGSPSPGAPLEAAGLGAPTPWERGLAAEAPTPSLAPTRSAAERRSELAPPGAPEFAAFDALMEQFMATHQVPTALVAVMHDGKLRYENGYGFLDAAGTKPTPPDAMMRIASITKPLTAALVAMLVEEGRMAWDDPVFCLPPEPAPDCLLPVAPHPSRPAPDARVAHVELRHLVEHRTGWTRATCTEPIDRGRPLEIAAQFGVPSPAPAWRLAQWFMSSPMSFDPGADPGELDPYCNLGYVILGLVAEAQTGVELGALYEAYLFRPLEVSGDIEPGHSLPERRNPREPFYACDRGKARNLWDPEEQVCVADGAFDLQGFLGAGGLVATPGAVAAAYEVFWNDGRVREPGGLTYNNGHSGGLPGTATTARRYNDGLGVLGDVQVVVLFNTQSGHELLPEAMWRPYELQRLYADLLAAYAAADAKVPAGAAVVPTTG